MSFLFLVAALVIIFFVIVQLVNPDSNKRVSELENSGGASSDPQRDWKVGAFLLGIGPLLIGMGLVGLVSSNWDYISPEVRLVMSIVLLLIVNVGGIAFYIMGQSSRRNRVLGEALLLIGTFVFGLTAYMLNDLVVGRTGQPFLGLSEIFGLWFLSTLPILYLTRSLWILGNTAILGVVWLATYLEFIFTPLFGVFLDKNLPLTRNGWLDLLLPVVAGSSLCLLYAKHQESEDQYGDKKNQSFYYIIGLLTYLTVGTLIYSGVSSRANTSYFENLTNGTVGAVMIVIITAILFMADLVLKKTFPRYKISYLVGGILPIAALPGLFLINQGDTTFNHFIGFYFLEIAYTVWLMVDYLREHNYIAKIMFYTFASIQIFLMTISNYNFKLFELILLLAILVYAAIIHNKRKPFVTFVSIVGVVSAFIKILRLNLDYYYLLLIVGIVLMAFGVYYTQTHGKVLEKITDSNKKDLPDSTKEKKEIKEKVVVERTEVLD